jgi:hypothetical protein
MSTFCALHVPDREPDYDDREEQHASDVEDFRDFERLDAGGLESERRAGNLRRIQDAGTGPRAERNVAHVEGLADNRKHEHADHTEKQDRAYRVGNLGRFRLHYRRRGDRRREAAYANTGG